MYIVVSHRHLQGQEHGLGPAFPMGNTQLADEGRQLVRGSCGVRRAGGSENMPREGAKREPDSHEASEKTGDYARTARSGATIRSPPTASLNGSSGL